jgi:hypothetical protein
METRNLRKGLDLATGFLNLVENRDPKLVIQSMAVMAARLCDRMGISREEFCLLVQNIPETPTPNDQ